MYLDKKQTNKLIVAAWAVYAAATLARLTYSASMVKIISELSVSNAEAGSVLSAFAVVYGIGQLVNGVLCRFYDPRIMVPVAMVVSASVTIMLPLAHTSTPMALLWAVNGAAQSILWSLIIRTLAVYVAKERIGHAIVVISTTTAVGTTAAYALSAVFVALGVWQLTFTTAGILCLVAGFLWTTILGKLGRAPTSSREVSENAAKGKISFRGYFLSLFMFMCIAAFFNGFVRDGVNSWMPKLLTEQFGVGDSLSIILTLLLPLFSVFGAFIARKTYFKIRNLGTLLLMFFGVSAVLTTAVYLVYPAKNLVSTLLLFICVACAMAAVNNVIVGMFPIDNRDNMDSGASAGILDTMCYVGSSVAGSVIGATAENSGWGNVFIILIGCALACAVISTAFALVGRRNV